MPCAIHIRADADDENKLKALATAHGTIGLIVDGDAHAREELLANALKPASSQAASVGAMTTSGT
jgi:hypothetical protein